MDEKKAPAAPNASAETELARRASDKAEVTQTDKPWLEPKFYWSGLPVYECPKCGPRIQFPGEGGRKQLADHMDAEHVNQLIPTGLVGSRGEPIYREVKE